jgi:hypothetical protein
MKPFLLTIAVFVFLSGAYFGNRNVFVKSQDVTTGGGEGEEVLAGTDENTGNVDVSPTMKPFPKLVTIVPSKPSSTPIPNNIFFELIYPKALVISQTQSQLNLVSMDTSEVISDWYKAKVKELNLLSTSTLFTQEEKKYMIKLTGDKNVLIEIKEEENGQVKIEIELE